MTTNPWENAFDLKSGTAILNNTTYFDGLLGDKKDAQYKPKSDDVPLYTVDTNLLRITYTPIGSDKEVTKSYASTIYTTFFTWLKTIKAYTNNNDDRITTYHIMNSIKDTNPELFKKIKSIVDKLEISSRTLFNNGGRRRHSRKYKKSKRVLRRKSRSTRRR